MLSTRPSDEPDPALSCGGAVAAAAGRLDRQPVAGLQLAAGLGRQLLAVEQVAPARAVGAAVGAGRRVAAALGDERVGHRRQRLELAHEPVAAAVAPGAARAAADRVAHDAQRELELERLDRRVERVGHRDVDGARPVGVGAGALAAAERLVVREAGVPASASAPSVMLFIVPWPSARPNAARTRSATRLEVSTLPPATAGAAPPGPPSRRALSSEPSGARTSIGR